jgi:hypothetical protein
MRRSALLQFVVVGSLCAGLFSSCAIAPVRKSASSTPQFHGFRGKVALSESRTGNGAKDGVTGDIDDYFRAQFDPIEDADKVIGVYFVVDTRKLDWRNSNCLQNNEDCADFVRMFEAQQQVVGSVTGERFTTLSGTLETGEVFYFTKEYDRFGDIKDALKAGVVSFIIRTNQAEKRPFDPYSVSGFSVIVETR